MSKPYDYAQIYTVVSTSEVELTKAPSDKYRCIYTVVLHDLSGSTSEPNVVTFNIYKEDGSLDKSFKIPLTAYATKVIDCNKPIITLPPNYVLKAVTSVGDAQVMLVFTDE